MKNNLIHQSGKIAYYNSYQQAEEQAPLAQYNAVISPNHDSSDMEADWRYFDVRALSATPVAQTDFRAANWDHDGGKVIKDSLGLFPTTGVFTDHNSTAGNWSGTVVAAWWQDAYVSKSGKKIPAGMNARYAISNKHAPRLVAALKSGGIKSNSVGIQFNWQPTHPDIFKERGAFEYMYLCGQKATDGSVISRIPTNIISFMETSLLEAGADKFARLLEVDGKITEACVKFSEGVGSLAPYNLPESLDVKVMLSEDFSAFPCVISNLDVYSDILDLPKQAATMETSETTPTTITATIPVEDKGAGEAQLSIATAKLSELTINLSESEARFTKLTLEHNVQLAKVVSLEATVADQGVKIAESMVQLSNAAIKIGGFETKEINDLRSVILSQYRITKAGDGLTEAEFADYSKQINEAPLSALELLSTSFSLKISSEYQATCSCGKAVKLTRQSQPTEVIASTPVTVDVKGHQNYSLIGK